LKIVQIANVKKGDLPVHVGNDPGSDSLDLSLGQYAGDSGEEYRTP
jgi:hypothetical protein